MVTLLFSLRFFCFRIPSVLFEIFAINYQNLALRGLWASISHISALRHSYMVPHEIIFSTHNKENRMEGRKRFGPYNLMNQYNKRTEVEFIDDDVMETLKNCSLSHLNVSTDVSFYIQALGSWSHSVVTYYRFDTRTVEHYSFSKIRYGLFVSMES